MIEISKSPVKRDLLMTNLACLAHYLHGGLSMPEKQFNLSDTISTLKDKVSEYLERDSTALDITYHQLFTRTEVMEKMPKLVSSECN